MDDSFYNPAISRRFRGFLPVVIDVETGGFDPQRDALLEIAAVILRLTNGECLEPAETLSCHVQPSWAPIWTHEHWNSMVSFQTIHSGMLNPSEKLSVASSVQCATR